MGGHYTCTAYNFMDGKWYYFDDDVTQEANLDSIRAHPSAYMLFYKRRDPTGKVS
jgi:ubiquitin carboxyl-terminal hydrolase 4/11/15